MLLSGQLSPERQRKAFETIDRNARSQAQLIEDLLDISRIISGKMRVDFKAVDLPTVISAAVEAVRPAAEAKRIRIDSILSARARPIIGDEPNGSSRCCGIFFPMPLSSHPATGRYKLSFSVGNLRLRFALWTTGSESIRPFFPTCSTAFHRPMRPLHAAVGVWAWG